MELTFHNNYKEESDKEIVEKIITVPYNEEAAAYLLEGTKRSVYLGENPKMVEEPRIEIVR